MSRAGLVSFLVLVLFLFVVNVPVCVFGVASADEAKAAVAGAQARIVVCFDALGKAESAGANVTELTSVLDEAGSYLSRAQVALEKGKLNVSEYDVAVALSSNCTGLLAGFTDRAGSLKDDAVTGRGFDFLVNVVGSAVGSIAVLVGGWILWVHLRRRYSQVGGAV